MTIYVEDYRNFRKEFFTVKQQQQNILRKALAELKTVYKGLNDMDFVIVINVEGYDCLAYISDYYQPIEIYPTVIPFSYEENKVYPMQDIKLTHHFIRE